MIIKRYIENAVTADLHRKMVFIGGPRQSGKTTLSRHLISSQDLNWLVHYLNWDDAADRENIMKEQFPSGSGLLILDEIHKYRRWRQVIKGLYDKRSDNLRMLVTGSARLDYYRRGGDSLQGRYFFYRLYPLSVSELNSPKASTVHDLLRFGGFPEPFLLASEKETKRWSRDYRLRLVREDLRDLEQVRDLDSIELLAMRLPDLVGSPLSLNALREDLQVSHQSVSRWVSMLENLYMLFRIYPFGAPRIRAVKKEAKHYHWDWTLVKNMGHRFENMVACHLKKWCCFLQDTEGREMELRFFRDIDRREVDFVLMEDRSPFHFIECKSSSKGASRSLKYLKKRFPKVEATQVTLEGKSDLTDKNGIRICPAHLFLNDFV